MLLSDDGPLWTGPRTLTRHRDSLRRAGAKSGQLWDSTHRHMIVGHTSQPNGEVHHRCGGTKAEFKELQVAYTEVMRLR